MNKRVILLRIGATVLVTAALLLIALSAAAQKLPPTAPSFFPTASDVPIWEWQGSNACNEMHPAIAYDEDNDRYLVVFDWDLYGTNDHDIVGVYVDANGSVLSWPFNISSSTDDDSYPAIARNPYTPAASDGSYLVVWQRHAGDNNYNIYAAIVSDTVSASFSLATWAGDQVYPDVAYATAMSRYLVVWEDHYPHWSNPPDIYGVSLDDSGGDVKYLPVTDDEPGSQGYPAVAVNAFDYRWLVVWQDTRNSGTTDYDIYGQMVRYHSGAIGLDGPQFQVSALPGFAILPDVAWGRETETMSAYGEFLVTWSEADDLFAQRVDGEFGSLTGSPITVSNSSGAQNNSSVLFAPNQQEWWVVWQDDRDYG